MAGCEPPFIVYTHSECMDARNPHPVLSLACACEAVRKASPPPADEPAPDKAGPLTAELPADVKAKVAAAMRALDSLK